MIVGTVESDTPSKGPKAQRNDVTGSEWQTCQPKSRNMRDAENLLTSFNSGFRACAI